MDYEIIDLFHNHQSERWIIVHADGRLILHTEHDGYSRLRHGRQPTDEPISLDDLRRRSPFVAGEVAEAQKRLKDRAP